MKKATLVLATLVAFLLSGPVFAARKVVTDMPTTSGILNNSSSSGILNGSLDVLGKALEGEYIPAAGKDLAAIPKASIPTANIAGLAKGMLKGNLASLAGSLALDELLKGLGWVMGEGGVITKPGTAGSEVPTTSGQYQWGGATDFFTSADEACTDMATYMAKNSGSATVTGHNVTLTSDRSALCSWDLSFSNGSTGSDSHSISRIGNGCPSNSSYSSTALACVSGGSSPAPITDTDLAVLDSYLPAQSSDFQTNLLKTMCGTADSCYKALNPTTALTGPATIVGDPITTTTTNSAGQSLTTTSTTTTNITYGSNYYDYTTAKTTTTTNNSTGETSTSTTDNADAAMPTVPDLFGSGNDGLKGINDSIPGTTATTSPIPYMAWYSFSQSCSEITLVIPVYGPFQTAICPVYQKYIWPTLYFFFAVFTWLHCWQVWRGTVMRVRAS